MSSFEQIARFPGKVGFYCRYLDEDRTWTHNPDLPLIAASVIKIPIMVTAMQWAGETPAFRAASS